MYRGTEKFQAFHARVASSSTKGHAGGLVETLPPDARPWEQLFNSMSDQYRIALDKLTAAQVAFGLAYERAAEPLPNDELTEIARTIRQHGQEILHYRQIAEDLAAALAQAAQNGIGACFVVAAKHALLEEQYASLMHTAHEMCRGTMLTQELPQPGPDPVNRMLPGRQKHLAHLLGDYRESRLDPATVAIERARVKPPQVVIKRGGMVIEEAQEPEPEDAKTAMQVAWTKALRWQREASVQALLRNEPGRKGRARAASAAIGRAQ
jgi:hypothetical protein